MVRRTRALRDSRRSGKKLVRRRGWIWTGSLNRRSRGSSIRSNWQCTASTRGDQLRSSFRGMLLAALLERSDTKREAVCVHGRITTTWVSIPTRNTQHLQWRWITRTGCGVLLEWTRVVADEPSGLREHFVFGRDGRGAGGCLARILGTHSQSPWEDLVGP